jgi:hypothetical protein
MFRHNVGGLDRALRVTLGGILFFGGLLLLTGKTSLGVTLAVVGLLALLTGIVRSCVLYIPFGISTARSGGQPLNQACDCAAWTKAMQDNRTTIAPPGSAEEEVAEATTAARGR